MSIKKILPLVAFAAVVGCMHGSQRQAKAWKVSDADVGRLGPGQVGPVDEARQALDRARDALSRTSLRLQQAQNEEAAAKADQQAAGADHTVAAAQQKMANDSRAPEALEKASQLQQQANAHGQVADLHAEYARQLVDERKAETLAAERQVKVAEARVEWSKLQALEQAGNPAATKYDARPFHAALNAAQADLDQAVQQAQQAELRANAARQRWEDSRRAQAGGSSDQTGTGSGR